MMYRTLIALILLGFISCKNRIEYPLPVWESYDESTEIAANKDHETRRLQYKLIQSKYLDKNKVWNTIRDELKYFNPEDYDRLKPLILEQDIPSIQTSIGNGALTYEELTLWYLYRIVHMESNPATTLHSIIALNPNAIAEARKRDQMMTKEDHLIYGMPILLKDNINTSSMNTTAGALALLDNQTGDAHIVAQLKSKGAIILGKANLSEWAYFFCGGCPVGYSAVGGQTLNPYGRRQFETGGSSAGSGTTMAANYAAAAVGTETSGSILSPSSKNSVVGLKPTVGRLSRSGIVPISSTLDTPGPMTRSVVDNAILMDAMQGYDEADGKMISGKELSINLNEVKSGSLEGKRFGAFTHFIERDSVYKATLDKIRAAGAEVVEVDPIDIDFKGFSTILNIDMKYDLPKYIKGTAGDLVTIKDVQDVIDYNLQDSILRSPYGQARLEGIYLDTTSMEGMRQIDARLQSEARRYFDTHLDTHNLDAILSINNYNAGFAAAAKYPCLTVPMGYKPSGEPISLTFINKSYTENKLLELGYGFEQYTKSRRMPEGYN